ncbi:MAG: ABC transporter substrate-binding protein, partial [Deltaproteobacteria bacterium]|nr:ABC transporter substrate-binding protein [Deltaproteobacteria bacterium]
MKLHLLSKTLRTTLLIIVFTTGVVFAGPDDVVTVALPFDPATVNVIETRTGVDLMLGHMHENLMAADAVTGEYRVNLAEYIKVMPNKKDFKIKLENGHLFHTGEPLTAHDIKWTYEQCADPANSHMQGSTIGEIEEIEVIDDHNLIFHFYQKYAPWRELMWIAICSKKYYEKVGKDKFRSHPVGSGPFRFVSRKIGESLTLESDPNYLYKENMYNKNKTKIIKKKALKKKVDYKTLKLIAITDPITRLSMLQTGEVDLIFNILPRDTSQLKDNQNIILKKISDVPSFYGMGTRPRQYPLLKDLKLQAALTHAINRQEIIDKIYLGEGFPLYMYAERSELGFDPNIKIEFNPTKARSLLKESSYDGTPLILSYSSAVPSSSLIATIIQNYLKNIGIKVVLQQLEGGTLITYIRKRDPKLGHMFLYAFGGGRDPQYRMMMTVMSDSIYTSYPDRPSAKILDQLVLKQAQELDEAKRLVILKKIHAILGKEPSTVPLYGLKQIYAMRDRIDYTWRPKAG